MQVVFFALIAFTAIMLNILTSQGFFNVSDRFLWKQTSNLISKRQPVKIAIPSVNIESSIERVGVDAAGKMQAPSSAKIVSWYQFGALPGEKGNLVLSGHKDSALGPGVFYTLESIKSGNPITLTDAKNNVFQYKAITTQIVDSEKLPVKEIFSDQKKDKNLYLITCAGRWNLFSKTYDKRALVFAQLI
jgi:LPXTG-site transpeptidase (sortase) family protein